MNIKEYYRIDEDVNILDFEVVEKAVSTFYDRDFFKSYNKVVKTIENKNELLLQYNKIKGIIDKLEPYEKELLDRRFRDGNTIDQVCEIMNINIRTAYRKYQKIANILKRGGVELG